MAKSWRSVSVLLLCLGGSIGCEAPDRGDEPTTAAQSALTTSLFQSYTAYATGSRPEAVAIGDLDGDGRKDIALVTSYYFDAANDYTVHVFLQNATGGLKPRVKYPVNLDSSSIEIGDVNGDGRADIVVGRWKYGTPGGIGVLLQNTAGTLDPMVSYPTANSYRVKVGDFNGDGRADIAGLNSGAAGDGLDLFLQTEGGTLAAPVTYHVAHGGFDELDAGDVNGDGRTDLVVMSGSGLLPNLNVLLQAPDGTFGAPTSYSVGGNTLTSGVAIGDTNGDGRSDIVVSYGGNRPSSFIGRFLQNAQGTLAPVAPYPSYDAPSAIVLADVDADGRQDVLVTHGGWKRLGVYRQFPSGELGSEELYQIGSATNFQPQGLAVGDINGDGRPDAVIADANTGLVVLRHVPDATLAFTVTAPAGGQFYVGAPLTVRWMTGDTIPLTSFDVTSSFNAYAPITGCTGLPATARECTFTPTGGASSAAVVRVTARDGSVQPAWAESTFNLVTPSITVTAPTFSQFVGVGGTTTVTWSHNLPPSETVRIELSRDGGVSYETLAAEAPVSNVNGTQGSWSWTVTGPTASSARLRVSANGSLAASGTAILAITTTPTLTVSSPSAGNTYYTTSFYAAWSSNAGNIGTVRIEVSRDGGTTYETIADSIPNTGTFTGAIAGPGATDARARVTMTSSFGTVSAVGSSFKLIKPELAVTNPVAGATLFTGTTVAIGWTTNLSGSATVELSRNGGSSYQYLGSSSTGSFNWVVAAPVSSTAQVRVTMNGGGSVVATSGTFSIAAPSLTVTSPTAGAALWVGAPLAITWSTNLPASAPVLVELSRDNGSTYEVLAANAPNTGSFATVVTGPGTGLGRVRVTVNGSPSLSATSGTFGIVAASLTLTSPSAGAVLYVGTSLAITWSTNLSLSSPVLVELSRDGGSTFETLAAAAPNTGSFITIVSGPEAATAVARVTIVNPTTISSTSGPFSIVRPSLIVTGPTAGTPVYAGTPVTISWTHNLSGLDPVSIALSRDGGATYEVLAAAAPNTGSFVWTASGPDTANARVRITASGPVPIPGQGPAFSIVTPSLVVTGPTAGTQAYAGAPVTITWTHNLSGVDPVSIELSRDGGATFEVLAATAPNTGSFVWTAAGPDTAEARVRVTASGALPMSGLGAAFSILTPSVTVTSPAAGESWAIGTARTISWSSSNLPAGDTVRVELSRDGGASWTVLAPSAPASGSQAWTATAPATTAAIIRVSSNGALPVAGASGPFSIGAPALAVTSPAAGASWTIGTAQAITWSTNLLPSATVKVQISRNGGGTYTTLSSSAPNTGSYVWTATGAATTSAVVRVTANGVSASGVSETFSLVAASVEVTSPNSAVIWTIGTVQTITWNHNLGAGAAFKIEVSRSGTWSEIVAETPAGPTSGSYAWTVTGPKTTNAKVRVTWTGGTTKDTSDVAFKIN